MKTTTLGLFQRANKLENWKEHKEIIGGLAPVVEIRHIPDGVSVEDIQWLVAFYGYNDFREHHGGCILLPPEEWPKGTSFPQLTTYNAMVKEQAVA